MNKITITPVYSNEATLLGYDILIEDKITHYSLSVYIPWGSHISCDSEDSIIITLPR